MNIAFPSLRQGMLCAFGAIEQSRVEKRVLMDADRAGAPVGRGDEAQATALFFGREVLLLIGGRDAGDVGLDPDLEEMRGARLVVVVLAVQYALPCAHALDVAGNDGRAGAHGVLVGKRALEHVADDLHVAVPVGAEARARGDAILVDDAQRPEPHVLRVLVAGEGKAVVRVEPAVVGMAALGWRGVGGGGKRQRDEPYLSLEAGRGRNGFLQRIEYAVGKRAAVRIGAGGVDEAEQGNPVVQVLRKARGPAIDVEHAPLGRRHDPVQLVAARRRRDELQRRQELDVVRQRRGGNQRGEQRGAFQPPVTVARCALVPSFMWWARPSFSLVKSTSNLRVSSLPSQAKPRRNCSLSAPPLSQLASSDEVMYRRLPSQLCEIMLICLPVTFS